MEKINKVNCEPRPLSCRVSPYSGRKFVNQPVYTPPCPSLIHAVRYVPSVVDGLLKDRVEVPKLGCKNGKRTLVYHHSDVFLLFNERRLQSLGKDSVRNYLDGLFHQAGYELPKGVTDEQLLDTVRSRYIQSPSELRDYIASIEAQQSAMQDDVTQRIRSSLSRRINKVVEKLKPKPKKDE